MDKITFEDFAKLDIQIGTIVEPRTIRGVESQGMILAADDGKPVLLHPEQEIASGSKVR